MSVMSVQDHVLVIDDEPQIQRFLKPSLTAAGYRVSAASNAEEGLRLAITTVPDVVLVDLGLPDSDGKDVIRRIRETSSVPVIVLSARERETEKIECLDLGADDYVSKPFGIGELLARIRAALRRRPETSPTTAQFSFGTVEIDTAAYRVTRDGEPVKLTPKEFDLLVTLARNAGRVMTHRQILKSVWGASHVGDTQYLRVFIGQLRQKIERDPAEPELILTEQGVGYRIADVPAQKPAIA